MANVKFTRDEVILALDVLYAAKGRRLTAETEAIQDLSALLNRLPIHAKRSSYPVFRNPSGVAAQIDLFRNGQRTGTRNSHVGVAFCLIANEFENRTEELHAIAAAIRRNEACYSAEYGDIAEADGFPEGALLGHLHRLIEARDGGKAPSMARCAICSLQPTRYYQACEELLQQHLLVPPTEMDGCHSYGAKDFLTVCPTCHVALHRYRPWRTKENCEEVLR